MDYSPHPLLNPEPSTKQCVLLSLSLIITASTLITLMEYVLLRAFVHDSSFVGDVVIQKSRLELLGVYAGVLCVGGIYATGILGRIKYMSLIVTVAHLFTFLLIIGTPTHRVLSEDCGLRNLWGGQWFLSNMIVIMIVFSLIFLLPVAINRLFGGHIDEIEN